MGCIGMKLNTRYCSVLDVEIIIMQNGQKSYLTPPKRYETSWKHFTWLAFVNSLKDKNLKLYIKFKHSTCAIYSIFLNFFFLKKLITKILWNVWKNNYIEFLFTFQAISRHFMVTTILRYRFVCLEASGSSRKPQELFGFQSMNQML